MLPAAPAEEEDADMTGKNLIFIILSLLALVVVSNSLFIVKVERGPVPTERCLPPRTSGRAAHTGRRGLR